MYSHFRWHACILGLKGWFDFITKAIITNVRSPSTMRNICLRERARFAKRTVPWANAKRSRTTRVKTILWLFAFWTLFIRVGSQRPQHLETCSLTLYDPKELPYTQQNLKFGKSVPKYFSGAKEIWLLLQCSAMPLHCLAVSRVNTTQFLAVCKCGPLCFSW